MDFADAVGPVRVNPKSVHIAHNEERRVFKSKCVLLQLDKCRIY